MSPTLTRVIILSAEDFEMLIYYAFWVKHAVGIFCTFFIPIISCEIVSMCQQTVDSFFFY